MIKLTDSQLHEVQQAARRQAFLEQLAAELRGKILGDGLVHRVAYEVAREITWGAERTITATG
jgi:ribosomal protein L15